MESFSMLGLSPAALAAVGQLGYQSPTPVQEQAIPLVLQGRDVIAAAKTGTGKTAAFALSCMSTLKRATKKQGPLMLVITPTRELAQQIGEVAGIVAQHTSHRVLAVVGGVSYEPQKAALRRGVDVLIATPGRLIDLMEQQAVRLDDVSVLVLDEADRMLDMGFWPSVKRIVAATPTERQTLLFSATIDQSVQKSAKGLLREPALVEIARKGDTADTVKQYVARAPQTLKADLLRAVLHDHGHKRVIVFTRTRSRADAACRRLKRAGYSVEAIHSSRTQAQRRKALDNFASGATDIIVATDVLARGIDVDDVSYVINYDLPNVPEDYVHRIGRTGRAGAQGFAVSLVTPEAQPDLDTIQKHINRTLPVLDVPSFDVEQAAAESAARATRRAAKNDPALAQEIKELAQKDKRKQAKKASGTDAKPAAKTTAKTRAKAKASAKPAVKAKPTAKASAKPAAKAKPTAKASSKPAAKAKSAAKSSKAT
ncbi:MAG: DEAD/DEAH box helicase, partial [Eggerthellaceae bacterium]|nr:DEAD/DEAH box helicase [Eggerthellaceae bacterium]